MERVTGGARNAGLAFAMTLLVVPGLGGFGVRGVFAQGWTPTTEKAGATTDASADASGADAA